jgi:hypothetical protein
MTVNLKILIKEFIQNTLPPKKVVDEKEKAVFNLGLGNAMASDGDKLKKDAKAQLVALGVLTGETGKLYEGKSYVLSASQRAGSTRLDAASLEEALRAEKISDAARRRILDGATVTTAPAVVLSVEYVG